MAERLRRLDRVLDPSYCADLHDRSLEDLRAMQAECHEVETEYSYVRRLAQARIEILEAELDRRAAGGSLGDLVAALPEILADRGARPDPATTRLPRPFAPSARIRWQRGLERLVSDSSLVNLPLLTDGELRDTLIQLRELERQASQTRHALHRVLDVLDHELARRLAHT